MEKILYFQISQCSCPTKKGRGNFFFPYSACSWGPGSRNWASAIVNVIKHCLLWQVLGWTPPAYVQGRVNASLGCSNPARSQERPVLETGPQPVPRKWALSPCNILPGKSVSVRPKSWPCNTSLLRQLMLTNVMYGEHLFAREGRSLRSWSITKVQWAPWHGWASVVGSTLPVLSHITAGKIKCVYMTLLTRHLETCSCLLLDFAQWACVIWWFYSVPFCYNKR